MTSSIGLSSFAFFHLLFYALFKALLFICAGGVINFMGDSLDIRFIGGLSVYTFYFFEFNGFQFCFLLYAIFGFIFLFEEFYFRDVFYEIFEYVWFFIYYLCLRV